MPFESQDHHAIDVFLGRQFAQDLKKGTVKISQRAAIKSFLAEEGVTKSKPIPYPTSKLLIRKTADEHPPNDKLRRAFLSTLGKVIYLSTGCVPQLVFAVSKFAQLAVNPTEEQHAELKKHVARPPCRFLESGTAIQ